MCWGLGEGGCSRGYKTMAPLDFKGMYMRKFHNFMEKNNKKPISDMHLLCNLGILISNFCRDDNFIYIIKKN